ncbi:MAG: hypothetical protein GW779_06445 [Candidatus Altiarchaeum hamiconexum]|uniref:Uncharacterized protein n=1 Tax=Candidatus Altarchaeum hamiconexum TaxID=1803513 RepID=A0A8J7YVT6_9ARCH|nr:hypothetical protein [Candidatus Altarchaeum hamiconexum]OIQ04761.1 MAG: hypothetical protein AUK59_06445 [Candidatus Altarchaeum sp. CG2_30_32_3053]PIN66978.1 MAG: hypothetical protein COV98_05385 [Candidatus Altarchaeum sp. CG12_big_fil_rev_8_21_14_0_65_33_22]PIV28681.1 MAG: hypothetical protein COS36_01380 [Candidatus Altarchaeum sp. CG03_land_8_20_14_0_80_32_618]PIZ29358.1 MAG: hypothetical protein COY41_05750 [Candidatus Altarchaeum sp. CG_4_10_14_0_8_um_filter_32_851]PJC14866.1 MAG: h
MPNFSEPGNLRSLSFAYFQNECLKIAKKYIKDAKDAKGRKLIFTTVSGSHSYGFQSEYSDID